jgi:hypothetical protein
MSDVLGDLGTVSRARQLLHLMRVRGLRRTLRAVVQGYVFSYRRWYIFYRPIQRDPPAPGADFEYRLATPADLESLAVFEPNRTRREFREWLENGALIFTAFQNGRPVAFQCFAHQVPTGPPLSSLSLGPGQLWTVDVQTLPEFRRHHVAQSLRSFRDRLLGPRGIREFVSSVQDDNLPALSYAYGGPTRLVERVERLGWLCVLGYRRIDRETDALARLERRLEEAGLLRKKST